MAYKKAKDMTPAERLVYRLKMRQAKQRSRAKRSTPEKDKRTAADRRAYQKEYYLKNK